ncbi:MAG: ABC transporter substrate-binding protein [Anaerolineae bacterium]
MGKYIRWQALLTVLGIVLVAAILFQLALRRADTDSVELRSDAQGLLATETTQNVPTRVVQVRGGTYIEGTAGYPHRINPLFSHLNDVDRDLCALVFEGLTQIDERNDVVPLLAEDWLVSDDGLTYTFHLRDSVRWQDGEPFTAKDVVFTIGLLQSEELTPRSPYAGLWQSVEVSAIDPHTVQFQLPEPYAPFLQYTTIGLLPEHLLRDVSPADLASDPFNQAPVGTGLFRVEAAISTPEHLVLTANQYHRLWAQTMLDEIEFRFYPSFERALEAYAAGQVMGVSNILAEDLDRARELPHLQLLSAHLSGLSMVLLNLNNPEAIFFQDERVRQALLYGLDRRGLVDTVLDGRGLVLSSPIMPQSWAYDNSLEPYPYDPARAVELLEEAGWTLPDPAELALVESSSDEVQPRTKRGESFEFTLLASDVPDRVALAYAIARQWGELGVRVEVEAVSLSELMEDHLRPRDYDAALVQWQVRTDPDPYPLWHSTQAESGQNYGGWVDRDADEAIEVARLLTDHGRRAELYAQFQEVFAERVPAILLYQPVYTFGVDARVRNVQIAPMLDPSGRFRTVAQWAVREEAIPLAELNDQVGDTLDKRGEP